VLPGQVRDGRDELEGGLRGLLAARAGLNTPARAPETGTPETPGGGGARAAVGEWVTGRGGARAPTEAEITAYVRYFVRDVQLTPASPTCSPTSAAMPSCTPSNDSELSRLCELTPAITTPRLRSRRYSSREGSMY
jgi:hypothetical protein